MYFNLNESETVFKSTKRSFKEPQDLFKLHAAAAADPLFSEANQLQSQSLPPDQTLIRLIPVFRLFINHCWNKINS